MRTGYHQVKVFTFKGGADETHSLPEGWKPFQAELHEGILWVYASLWMPNTKTNVAEAVASAERTTREATECRLPVTGLS